MNTLFLDQFIIFTRGNNILDLALGNNELLIQNYLSKPTTFFDHIFLDITLNYNQQRIPTDNSNESKPPLAKFNYSNADWDQLNHALKEINWTTVLGDNSGNKAYHFLTKVEEVCKNILPIKVHKSTQQLIPRE